jgi:hypothetical protein
MRIGDNGGRVGVAWSGGRGVNWRGGVDSLSGLRDDSVESVVMVSCIMDSAGCAVRFKQAVIAFNFVTNTLLCLLLDVVGMGIVDSVFEFVISWSLNEIFC